MTTSATGNRSGFTIIEMLAALLIIGLAATVTMLTLPDPRGALGEEGARLAARLAATRDAAIMENRAMAVQLDEAGHQVMRREGRDWQPVGTREFGFRPWAEGTEILLDTAPQRVSFDPTSLASPATLVLRRGTAQLQIDVDAGGAVRLHAD